MRSSPRGIPSFTLPLPNPSLPPSSFPCTARIPGVHIRENRLRKYARFMHQYRARTSPICPLPLSFFALASSSCSPVLVCVRPAPHYAVRCGAVRPEGGAGPCIIQEVHVILNDNRIDSQEFDLMQIATGGFLAVLFDSFLG